MNGITSKTVLWFFCAVLVVVLILKIGSQVWETYYTASAPVAAQVSSLVAQINALDTSITQMQAQREQLQKLVFHDLAKDVGAKYNKPWRIIYGVWMRESLANPNTKGDGKKDSTGKIIPGTWQAFGIGQVHQSTAKGHYDATMTKERLLDPIEGAYASGKVLSDYIDLFGNSPQRFIYGVSAYQQGPAPAKAQFAHKSSPKNIDYVLDVMSYASTAQD